jgi:hypothetical protein
MSSGMEKVCGQNGTCVSNINKQAVSTRPCGHARKPMECSDLAANHTPNAPRKLSLVEC